MITKCGVKYELWTMKYGQWLVNRERWYYDLLIAIYEEIIV